MNYEYLVQDIITEAGESISKEKVVGFIREIENLLWNEVAPMNIYVVEPITIVADTNEVNYDTSLWLQVNRVVNTRTGEFVKKVSLWKIDELYSSESGYPYVKYWAIDAFKQNATIKVFGTPTEDVILDFFIKKREAPLQPGDTEENKFFLREGYGLIKYGVLSMRVFNPDKWPAWKQQYDRELKLVRALISKGKRDYRECDRRFF